MTKLRKEWSLYIVHTVDADSVGAMIVSVIDECTLRSHL